MSILVLQPNISTLISTEGTVSIVGGNVGLEGVSVKVGSMDGVTVLLDDVDVDDKAVSVAVIGGRRIIGVAVCMEGVRDGREVGGL